MESASIYCADAGDKRMAGFAIAFGLRSLLCMCILNSHACEVLREEVRAEWESDPRS